MLSNDVYKRYLYPKAPMRQYVRMGYVVSFALVLVAIVVGMNIPSIHAVTKWITALLYGGYIAPNILKWHWWRFNGYGYFGGMIGGVLAAMVFPLLFPGVDAMYGFPFILLLSTALSILVCLKTPPESDEVLEGFYRDVRPWGWWGPVHRKLIKKHPNLKANRDFGRDAFNVAIGIVWQLMLMVVPICLVIGQYKTMWISIVVLAVTSVVMKFTWYDRLGPGGMYVAQEK